MGNSRDIPECLKSLTRSDRHGHRARTQIQGPSSDQRTGMESGPTPGCEDRDHHHLTWTITIFTRIIIIFTRTIIIFTRIIITSITITTLCQVTRTPVRQDQSLDMREEDQCLDRITNTVRQVVIMVMMVMMMIMKMNTRMVQCFFSSPGWPILYFNQDDPLLLFLIRRFFYQDGQVWVISTKERLSSSRGPPDSWER